MSLFHKLKSGPNPPEEIYMIVENPKGAQGKYEMDKESGAFMLDRVAYAPMPFIFEYGLIPQTWNKYDDDPTDIMCVVNFPTFAGCVMPVRPIALLELDDTGEIDHKILAVQRDEPRMKHVQKLEDLPEHQIKEIEFFWAHYKDLQPDKYTKVLGWKGKKEACRFLEETIQEYKKKFGHR